jgi:hypothetical protein
MSADKLLNQRKYQYHHKIIKELSLNQTKKENNGNCIF